MAYVLGYPKYNIESKFYQENSDDSITKTFSNVNLAIGGSSSGYTPTQIHSFLVSTASLIGGRYIEDRASITSSMTLLDQ